MTVMSNVDPILPPPPPAPPPAPPPPPIRLMLDRSDSPYRGVPVATGPIPAQVEAAHCVWCRHVDGDRCDHPCYADREMPHQPRWRGCNPQGECPHHEPDRWTRLLRLFHIGRAPILVDPRVWSGE